MSGVAGLTTKGSPMSRPQPLQPRNAPIYDGCATLLLPQATFPSISGVRLWISPNSNIIPSYILKLSFRLEFGIPVFSRRRPSLSHMGLAIAHLKPN